APAVPAGPSGLKWVLAAIAAAGSLGACLLLASSVIRSVGHHVEGKVMFLQRPLPEAMLCFHAGDATVPCASTVTAKDGRFSVDMPAGSYKVTVRSVGDSDQGIPPAYGQAESTRFKLSVDRDVTAATMFIESK
ncbi:MAG: carboxypeptidase-like regulatory domain-containing protein, partial [Planctomycetia bacterium]